MLGVNLKNNIYEKHLCQIEKWKYRNQSYS